MEFQASGPIFCWHTYWIGLEETKPQRSSSMFNLLQLLILVFVLLISSQVDAQDVYNFNFYKSSETKPQISGPTAPELNPAINPTTPVVAPQTPVTQQTLPVVASETKKSEFRNWEVGARLHGTSHYASTNSFGNFKDEFPISGTYYGLSATRRINKFIGFTGGLTYSEINTESYDRYSSKTDNFLDGSIGIEITPIHLSFFGYELFELGGSLGYMSTQRFVTEDELRVDIARIVVPYVGLKLAINFTESIGLVVASQQAIGSKLSDNVMTDVGLRYRF